LGQTQAVYTTASLSAEVKLIVTSLGMNSLVQMVIVTGKQKTRFLYFWQLGKANIKN